MKKVQLSVVDGSVKVIHEDQEFTADPGEVLACAEALAGARCGAPTESDAGDGRSLSPRGTVSVPGAAQLPSEAEPAANSNSRPGGA